MNKETTITITLVEYMSLINDADQLAHLEANGVDCWEGYSRYDSDEDEEDWEIED